MKRQDIIEGLAATFAAWRATDSPWRAQLASELPRYSSAVIDRGVTEALADWNAAALQTIREKFWGGFQEPEYIAVSLASSVPTAAFSAIALPLLSGSAVTVRASSNDPISPRLFLESIRAVAPNLGRKVDLGANADSWECADLVIAYGSDTTMRALRNQLQDTRLVTHGHKLSVGAIGSDIDLHEAARRLAHDAALFDGRGCLSPAYALVDSTDPERPMRFSAALAQELMRLADELPRGPLTLTEQARLRERRAAISMRENTQSWLSERDTGWGVWLTPAGTRPEPGVLRHLCVVPVDGIDGLDLWCGELGPHLSSLGVAGWSQAEALRGIAGSLGASRVCALGSLQTPALDEMHHEVAALTPALRRFSAERQ